MSWKGRFPKENKYFESDKGILYCNDVVEQLPQFPSESIDCVITSPPYWALRDYGVDGQIGLEPTFQEYLEKMWGIFSKIYRILKSTGTCWVVMGDTYSGSGKGAGYKGNSKESWKFDKKPKIKEKLPSKCLCMIPERFAIGMIERGWILRNQTIWCLAENTTLFVKRDEKYLHISIKEVEIGDKIATIDKDFNIVWVKIKNKFFTGIKNAFRIITKSGREIVCSEEHRLPCKRNYEYGNFLKLKFKQVKELDLQDKLFVNYILKTGLSEGNEDDYQKGFIVGFFIAEGTYRKRKVGIYKDNKYSLAAQRRWGRKKKSINITYGIQLACGKKDLEKGYLEYFNKFKLKTILREGDSILAYSDNKDLLNLIKEYVDGNVCDTKHLSQKVWNTNVKFIQGIIDGFLAGDGYYDKENDRWCIGIKPNQKLKNDLLLACRIVGYDFRYEGITDNNYGTKTMTFVIRKKLKRKTINNLYLDQIHSIENIGNVSMYDIEVEPIYTSYCGKGETNKPTKEAKKQKWNNLYFLANGIWTHNCKPNAMPQPVKDRFTVDFEKIFFFTKNKKYYFKQIKEPNNDKYKGKRGKFIHRHKKQSAMQTEGYSDYYGKGRNKRTVWSINTKPFKGAHFAVFPPEIPELCIQAGCPEGSIVLDPFFGAGTVGVVAEKMRRKWIGIEINPEYCEIAKQRILKEL